MKTCVLSCLVVLAGAAAEEPAPDPAALVRLLSDESFAVREQAACRLRKLGKAAEPALREGLKSPEAEVRDRCQGLLDELQRGDREGLIKAFLEDKDDRMNPPLPGWRRYAKLAGGGPAARKSFAAMSLAAGDLLEAAEKDPKEAANLVAARAPALAPAFITSGRDEEALAEAAALLFVATDPRIRLAVPAFNAVASGLEVLANREALRKKFLEDAGYRKLLVGFVQHRWDGPLTDRALPLAASFELKECADGLAALALARETEAATRGWALLAFARLGGKADVKRLEPLLDDATPVGTKKVGAKTLRAEVRDVALAAVVQLSGRQPDDFGFPYFQALPGLKTIPSPACCGFADGAGREAALKKWKDFTAGAKK
jgi:hypothetical protein